MLKVVYNMRRDCAQALIIFHWLMSFREDSTLELVLKVIGRLMEARDGKLMVQGGGRRRERVIPGSDYC